MAHIFDLEILPAGEDQLSPVVVFPQVAGTVYPLRIVGIQGILDEMGPILLRVAVIPQGQSGAPDTDLALDIRVFHQPVFFIQQEHILIGEGHTNGHALRIVPVLFQNVIGAVAGDFRGAVDIDIQDIGQVLAELLQGLQGHHLAGVDDSLHRLRDPVIQGMEARNQAQGGHRPDHGGGAGVAEKINELGRGGEEPSGNHCQGRTGTKGGIDVLHGHVKIKGGLIGNHVGAVNAEQRHKAVDKIHHTAVSHGDALGHTGGAGGKVYIKHIGIDGPCLPQVQQVRVHLFFGQAFHRQEPRPGKELPGPVQKGLLGDNDPGLQNGHNLLQAGAGQLRIQAGIKTARPYRAHEHRHRIGALFHIYAHRLPLCSHGRQTGPYTPGQTVVGFVGIGFAVIQHRRPLGITFGTGAEVFQHVIHICSSFGVFYGAMIRISL